MLLAPHNCTSASVRARKARKQTSLQPKPSSSRTRRGQTAEKPAGLWVSRQRRAVYGKPPKWVQAAVQAARAGPGGNQPTLGVPVNWGRHGTARTSADGRPAGDSEASGCAGFFSEGHAETSAYRPSHTPSYLNSKGPPQGDGVLSSRGPPPGQGIGSGDHCCGRQGTPGGLPGSGDHSCAWQGTPGGGLPGSGDHCCG